MIVGAEIVSLSVVTTLLHAGVKVGEYGHRTATSSVVLPALPACEDFLRGPSGAHVNFDKQTSHEYFGALARARGSNSPIWSRERKRLSNVTRSFSPAIGFRRMNWRGGAMSRRANHLSGLRWIHTSALRKLESSRQEIYSAASKQQTGQRSKGATQPVPSHGIWKMPNGRQTSSRFSLNNRLPGSAQMF